jgi:hypothetical protein
MPEADGAAGCDMRRKSKPGERRKVPLKVEMLEPEEWEALGLDRHELVISPASAEPSGTQPKSGTKTSRPGQKPPNPNSTNT